MLQPFLRIGTSGFSYPQWKTAFYPKGTAALAHYARHFDTVEINNSFYRLPAPETLKRWAGLVPPDFCFAVKAWRGITHGGRLRDPEVLGTFMARMQGLGERLGPILFQLPANLPFDAPLLADFLQTLPKGHRYAFETRHDSWNDERAHALLFDRQVALVHAHRQGWSKRVYTAPFAYLRLHGTRGAYRGSYVDAFLKQLPAELEDHALDQAYVYFNNTMEGMTAVRNATHLKAFAAQTWSHARRHA